MRLEDYAAQVLAPAVYHELCEAVGSNRWLAWEHFDQVRVGSGVGRDGWCARRRQGRRVATRSCHLQSRQAHCFCCIPHLLASPHVVHSALAPSSTITTQGIIQLVKKLPVESAVEKLQEITYHSFKVWVGLACCACGWVWVWFLLRVPLAFSAEPLAEFLYIAAVMCTQVCSTAPRLTACPLLPLAPTRTWTTSRVASCPS